VKGITLLDYIEVRKEIYIPTYRWVLEYKVASILDKLREAAQTKTIVLLDYNTNADVEGIYPYEEKVHK